MQVNPVQEKKGLSDKGSLSSQALMAALPSNNSWNFGKAIDNGDCFYDAVAQAITSQLSNSNKPNTVKSLRLLCANYLYKLNAEKPKNNWVMESIEEDKGIDSYQDHLTSLQYTQEEMTKFKFESKALSGYAIWGKPHIEGRILATQLEIKLHIIEFHETNSTSSMTTLPPVHMVITGDSVKQVEQENIDYEDNTMLHLAVYRQHFVPISKSLTNAMVVQSENSKRELTQFTEHSQASESSLAPHVKKIRHLLVNQKIDPGTRLLLEIELKELEQIEETYNKQVFQQQQEEENAKFYEKDVEFIKSIDFYDSITVEILFDKENKLSSRSIDIRKGGWQGRHSTPIALIERIIIKALVIGRKLEDIITSLMDKIELFKVGFDEKTNGEIQKIFDGYKSKESQTSGGLGDLIKILANYYHKNSYLAFNDEYIALPKTNQCYLVPTLDFGGEKYIHNGEGSFITALLKILDGFEKKVEEGKDLKEHEIAQMNYAVLAMLDFMSLPDGSKDPKNVKLDPKKHRYLGEPKERLWQVVGAHLLYVFEVYPKLFKKYGVNIREAFYSYITNGVSIEDLQTIFNVNDESQVIFFLRPKHIFKLEVFKPQFTNAGSEKGFASQYKMKPKQFKKLLEQSVTEWSRSKAPMFNALWESTGESSKNDEDTSLQDKIDSLAVDILYISFLYDEDMDKNFKNFIYFPELGVNKSDFNSQFSLLSKDEDKSNNKSSRLRPRTQMQRESTEKNSLIRSTISEAYFNAKQKTEQTKLRPQFNALSKIHDELKKKYMPQDQNSTDSDPSFVISPQSPNSSFVSTSPLISVEKLEKKDDQFLQGLNNSASTPKSLKADRSIRLLKDISGPIPSQDTTASRSRVNSTSSEASSKNSTSLEDVKLEKLKGTGSKIMLDIFTKPHSDSSRSSTSSEIKALTPKKKSLAYKSPTSDEGLPSSSNTTETSDSNSDGSEYFGSEGAWSGCSN